MLRAIAVLAIVPAVYGYALGVRPATAVQRTTSPHACEAESEWAGAAVWSDKIKEPEPVFTIEQIKDILPHRYPFLLVDKAPPLG